MGRLPKLLPILAVCLAGGMVPLLAQDEDTTEVRKMYIIDEVTVTGTRTTKKVIDVPFPTMILDTRDYRFERKTAVNDVMQDVPGLFMQSRYGNHDVRISIRGFGSRSNTGIRGVRILLDGIPESEPDGQTRIEAIDFHSIGKIEIVKGNASSLYTNAPGGVINFVNDIYFPATFGTVFNEYGSHGLHSYGFKAGIKTENYRFLLTCNRHEADGYRPHSDDKWDIFNSVIETKPSSLSTVSVFGNYVNGIIHLPGSLTKAQFDTAPFSANKRDAVDRNAFRLTKKGRAALQYKSFFGDENELDNEIELTGYMTTKYFHRTAASYRIFNRDGVGAGARYIHHAEFFGRKDEFSIGGDMYYQTGPISEFENHSGQKGDGVTELTDETISNAGFYIQNSINVIKEKSDLLITGRYDRVVFENEDQNLAVRNAKRRFSSFTPKAALNYKITRTIAAYTSYGLGFDTPAGNELDNFDLTSNPNLTLNPDLKAQKSRNFELGIKGNLAEPERPFFKSLFFEITFFNTKIEDEIVPFDVSGSAFYRNAAKTDRTGFELGTNLEVVTGLRFKTAYALSNFKYDLYQALSLDGDSTVSYDGNEVPSVPKHNLSLVLSYERSIGRHVTGFAKMTYQAVSGMMVNDANSEKSKGYQVLNSTVGLDMVFGQFNVLATAGMNNMMDKTYAAFININSARKEFYEAGEPRSYFFGVTAGYRF